MELAGIIEEKDMRFGIKASKIKADYVDIEPIRRKIQMEDGTIKEIMESIDVALIFKPKTAEQAIDITIFLRNRAPNLPGGYLNPDLRATSTDLLKKTLTEQNLLRVAVANVYGFKKGSIIALKQESEFGKPWKPEENLVHPKLFEYLLGSGEVKP